MFGLFYGRLTAAEIRSVESSPHPALLGISLKMPMDRVLLVTANSTTNVLSAYSLG